MPLDPFSAGFLSSLAANLATQLLNGAGKRTRELLAPTAKQQALTRCTQSGIVALTVTATAAEKEHAAHLADIFKKFFNEPEVGEELARLVRGEKLSRADLALLFAEAGYDARTLPQLNFEQALTAFETAFLSAAVEEPELRDILQAAEMLKQTHLQTDLLAAVRDLRDFLRHAHAESLSIQAGVLSALREKDHKSARYEFPQQLVNNSGLMINARDVTIGGDAIGRDSIKLEGSGSGHVIYAGEGATVNVGEAKDHAATASALRQSYLNHLFEEARKLSLSGIDPKAASSTEESRLQLEAVYTALLTQASEGMELRERAAPAEREQRRLSALEQLNQHQRLVLLGDPGSGKSTFVNFVAMCLAGEALHKPEAHLQLLRQPLPNAKKEEQKPQPWQHGVLLPVRVILRDFAAQGLPAQGTRASAEHVWNFIAAELGKHNLADYAPHLRTELMQTGGLLLLDGLDEVPEAEQRRQQLKQAVEDFVACYGKCRVLVTSRTYAYQKQDWRLARFAETVLAPFTQAQIQHFITHWYSHIAHVRGLNREDAQGRAVLLQRAITNSTRLQGLAERPLLLTLMASLHAWRGGSLPEKREELYADTVDLLLDWWESPKVVRATGGSVRVEQPSLAEYLKVDRKKVRELLNELAFRAHGAQPELTGTADVAEADLLSGLLRLSTNPDVRPLQLVEYLSQRAGLLLPRGVRVYTFPHRTFQEYLAACYLTDHDFPDQVANLARRDPNRWREVALLAGAKAVRGSASAIWLLVEALCENDYAANNLATADVWGAHLAAQALAETGDLQQVPTRNQKKLARVQDWLVHIMGMSDFAATERALAGDTLARLGETRNAVTTLEHMEFCLVPAGPFHMGSADADQQAYGDEKPQHLNQHLNYDYWLARYPVTVAQYAQFVEATKHKPENARCLQDLANRPVCFVTWHEAIKFCEWLTQHWRAQNLLPTNLRVHLPSEAEWEKAARGGVQVPQPAFVRTLAELHAQPSFALVNHENSKRRFPWGDKADPNRANYSDTKIGDTSAVGCFPNGASPYGCEEMSGNVWEWTRSLKQDYPYDPNDGRENLQAGENIRRVVRGGAFDHLTRPVRCSFRYWSDPYFRLNLIGFRIALSP